MAKGISRGGGMDRNRIENYEVMHGVGNVDKKRLFSLSCNTRPWQHQMKLQANRFRRDGRKYRESAEEAPCHSFSAGGGCSSQRGSQHFRKHAALPHTPWLQARLEAMVT